MKKKRDWNRIIGTCIFTSFVIPVGFLIYRIIAIKVTGQNYGAHYYKRIKKGYQVAIGLSISYAVLTTTLFMIFAIPMASTPVIWPLIRKK